MMPSFVLPANGAATPESIARKRKLAELMMREGTQTGPIGHWSQGAARMVNALMGGIAMNRADKAEGEGRKSASEVLARALSGDMGAAPSQQDPNGAMMEAINNPWQSPQGSAMAMDMWKRQNTPVDPMKQQRDQLELQKLEAEIAKMNNPQASTEYGLNPQYGIDAEGNPVLIQVGKNGQAVQTQMPPDVQLSKAPIKLDAGTHFILLDPITRQPVGQIPKDLAGAESQKAQGKATGEARADLPGAVAQAEVTKMKIDRLINDPNLERAVGWTSYAPDMLTPNGVISVRGQIRELQGGAFLEARQMLKGGGQITDFEGKKAEAAFTRMETAIQSSDPQEFRQALTDFRDAVDAGVRKLSATAGVPMPEASAPAPGQQPTTEAPKRLKFNPETGDFE